MDRRVFHAFDLEAVRLGRDGEREATAIYLERMAADARKAAHEAGDRMISARAALEGLARNFQGAAAVVREGRHR